MVVLPTLRAAQLALVLAPALLAPIRGAAAGTSRAVELIEALQEHVARCQDYEYDLASYERKGDQQEEQCCRFFGKGDRLVRVRVLQGRGRGSEAVMDAEGRVRARKGGLLKPFARTLRPDDPRVCDLRGMPFWEAACPHYLQALRLQVAQPGSECELGRDPAQPALVVLTLHRPGGIQEWYWIDPQGMHLVRGVELESGLLVHRFAVANIRENAGLSDSFFAF
jgi:outer membrane lipoprotein-sorting protein